jgi:hypothetical protein
MSIKKRKNATKLIAKSNNKYISTRFTNLLLKPKHSTKILSADKKLDLILTKLNSIEKSQKAIVKDENKLIKEEDSMILLEKRKLLKNHQLKEKKMKKLMN